MANWFYYDAGWASDTAGCFLTTHPESRDSQTLIRVLVVDVHAAVRLALGTFLQVFDDLGLAGEAASGARALALCHQTQPDIVLLGASLPDMDAMTMIRTIRQRWPLMRVIVLVSLQEEDMVSEALQAGASLCLEKTISADELVKAIRLVYRG